MRNSWSSKQRLWLGSDRYTRCSGRRHTDTDTYGYSNRNAYSHRHCHCHGYPSTDANAKVGAIAKAAPHAAAQALISPCWRIPDKA
jgi:hypothetical protein